MIVFHKSLGHLICLWRSPLIRPRPRQCIRDVPLAHRCGGDIFMRAVNPIGCRLNRLQTLQISKGCPDMYRQWYTANSSTSRWPRQSVKRSSLKQASLTQAASTPTEQAIVTHVDEVPECRVQLSILLLVCRVLSSVCSEPRGTWETRL